MAKIGAQRAAELTGKSKSTIQRAMNSGKISYEFDGNGRRVIDTSELDRAFGLKKSNTENTAASSNSVEAELEKATTMLEMERLKMRVKMLEDKLETSNAHMADIKQQRDQWQKQASQMLITNQSSQQQADELRQELKQRDQRVQERRQKRLQQRMLNMSPENQNSQSTRNSFHGLWKRVKGR